ncbi:MAG: hypothetical protein M0C28_01615 [Candidatus Moduliflexus flocculans]|nr:hypothetical protein [Candidatus Moduliflexus flocculans]
MKGPIMQEVSKSVTAVLVRFRRPPASRGLLGPRTTTSTSRTNFQSLKTLIARRSGRLRQFRHDRRHRRRFRPRRLARRRYGRARTPARPISSPGPRAGPTAGAR